MNFEIGMPFQTTPGFISNIYQAKRVVVTHISEESIRIRFEQKSATALFPLEHFASLVRKGILVKDVFDGEKRQWLQENNESVAN